MATRGGGLASLWGDESHQSHFWDRIAQIAAEAFDVPAVFLQVADRSASTLMRGTPQLLTELRAFVQQMDASDAALVIERVAEHERIAAQMTNAGFVAAMPILDMQRQWVGGLGLADATPRAFSDVERERLQALAALAGARLYPLGGTGEGQPLERILQRVAHGIVVTDPDGRVTWVNEGFTQLCGYALDELRGRKPGELLQGPRTDLSAVMTMREHLQDGEGFTTELINYHKSGAPYRVRIEAEPIVAEAGALTGFIAFESEVRRNGQPLEDSLHRIAVETVDALVITLDAGGGIVHVNEAARRITGYEMDTLTMQKLVPEEEHAKMEAILEAHRAGMRHSTLESDVATRQGKRRRIAWSNTVVTDTRGRQDAQYILLTGIDITEQRQMEAYAIQATEAERRQLGEELHDLITAPLMGMAMMAKGIERGVEQGQEVTLPALRTIVEQTQETVSRVQVLLRTLIQEQLRSEELGSALRRLAADKEALTGVPFDLELAPTLPSFDAHAATHLYGIACDAINKILQHVGLSRVWVRLAYEQGEVVLSVHDDGVAPGEERMQEEEVDVQLMRQRARAIGAIFRVESAAPSGTVIRCALRIDDGQTNATG